MDSEIRRIGHEFGQGVAEGFFGMMLRMDIPSKIEKKTKRHVVRKKGRSHRRKICLAVGCRLATHGRNLCSKHYQRFLRARKDARRRSVKQPEWPTSEITL